MMFQYLLDTNVLSEAMRPSPNPAVLERLLSIGAAAATASPVWHELDFGRLCLPPGRRRKGQRKGHSNCQDPPVPNLHPRRGPVESRRGSVTEDALTPPADG